MAATRQGVQDFVGEPGVEHNLKIFGIRMFKKPS